MSSVNRYVYEKSNESAEQSFEFSGKRFGTIPDTNTGSYTNMINFDCKGLSGNDYVNLKESYIAVPLVLSLQNNALATFGYSWTSEENIWAASLKNHVLQIIDGVSVSLGGNTIVSYQKLQNLLINFKILSSFSNEDMANLGPTILFGKDACDSYSLLTGAGKTGMGLCNNVIVPTTFAPSQGMFGTYSKENVGRRQRQKYINTNSSELASFVGASDATLINVQRNRVDVNSKTLNNITYHIMAILPLRLIHPCFENMPLIKNANFQISLYCHTGGSFTYTVDTEGTNTGNIVACTSQWNSGFCPLMITNNDKASGTGNFLKGGTVADTVVTATLAIVSAKNINANATDHSQKQCRLYASMCTLTPEVQAEYESDPSKSVRFWDNSFNDSIKGITSGSSVNQLLGVQLPCLRRLVIMPFLSSAGNGNAGVSSLMSAFSSCGGTTAPYAFINNLQVTLGTTPLFSEPKQYSFQHFIEQLRPAGSLNGGLMSGLSSGLISQYEYEQNYGFIVVDLSVKNEAIDKLPQQVTVSFNNLSPLTMDYVVFIEYEKQITVNCITGNQEYTLKM